MIDKLKIFFSKDYLFSVSSGTKFENVYLYLAVFLILMAIGFIIFVRAKSSRMKIAKGFNKVWFWGYLTIGVIGLFIWFSRTQGLSIFSTRFVSYNWLLLIIIFSGYLTFLFKTKVPKEVSKYYEKKRKEKYLR